MYEVGDRVRQKDGNRIPPKGCCRAHYRGRSDKAEVVLERTDQIGEMVYARQMPIRVAIEDGMQGIEVLVTASPAMIAPAKVRRGSKQSLTFVFIKVIPNGSISTLRLTKRNGQFGRALVADETGQRKSMEARILNEELIHNSIVTDHGALVEC